MGRAIDRNPRMVILAGTVLLLIQQACARGIGTPVELITDDKEYAMWEPGEGTREEFFKCRGMTCPEWDKVMTKVKLAIVKKKGLDPVDGMNDLHGDELEGCFWYTEDQIDNVITEMEEGQEPADRVKAAHSALSLLNKMMARIKGHHNLRTSRKIHSGLVEQDRKWKNPIIYKFDGTHSTSERTQIREAFMHWQSRTCMKFFELENSVPLDVPHLLLSKENGGCYSYIGRSFEGPQIINLSPICLQQFGVAVHEIGHALGFWHEQQRSDRDDYVQIVDENISAYKSQFFKQPTKTRVPYDYGSVMHYSSKSGSYVGKQTIVPSKAAQYSYSMGQRIGLSYFDTKAINLEYCHSSCKSGTPPNCLRGGYQDPNNCRKCICPDGFGGDFCDTTGPYTKVKCGGVVKLKTGMTRWIESPGYDDPMYYEDNTECNWLIQAPFSYGVILSFEGDFGMYCRSGAICNHYIEVKYEADLEYPGPRYCCNEAPKDVLKSKTSEMVLVMRSSVATPWSTSRRGFKAKLTTERLPVGSDGRTPAPALPPRPPSDTVGIIWSDWGRCQNSQCKCGGCSVSTRYRLCDGKRCMGSLARSESKSCVRLCGPSDTELVYAGTFFERSCEVCCFKKGFTPIDGTCRKSVNG